MKTKHLIVGSICVLMLAIVFFWSRHGSAQHLTRDLTGSVTNGHHEPLRGAIVQVHSEYTGSVVSYITDESGHYGFKRLEGDLDYTVWATWRGRRSTVKKLSLWDSKTNNVIDLEISPGE